MTAYQGTEKGSERFQKKKDRERERERDRERSASRNKTDPLSKKACQVFFQVPFPHSLF